MGAVAYSVAFVGVEARLIEVQCAISPGLPGFAIVGLPNKAVTEAKERIRAAFAALQIAMPSKRVTVNLSPADLPKEGSHFDLPIALAILAALDVVPADELAGMISLGELALDGRLMAVPGAMSAAMAAGEEQRGLICPPECGPEAAWVQAVPVIAPRTLRAAVDHLTGRASIAPARAGALRDDAMGPDMRDVRGQERARRALEIAAAGRHHMLMVGPPGAGKSMLAARLPGLLPALTAMEALESSMIHSLAGALQNGEISKRPPYRAPHHTASMAALVGGGRAAGPGEISLAHHGVLFLDELPEFPRMVLDTLRQPLETGEITVARANAHIRYPSRFLLIAAANPCRCGQLADPGRACSRAPICGEDYLGRVSGPMLDRFDLRIEVPPVAIDDLNAAPQGESTDRIAQRVARARAIQAERLAHLDGMTVNAEVGGALLDEIATPDRAGQALIARAAKQLGLSARGYHRVLRCARTIADLDGGGPVRELHIAEAISYRLPEAAALAA